MILQMYSERVYCHTGFHAYNPARPSVVFIHGAQNDHSVWQAQLAFFAGAGWNVFAPDLPGHGRSSGYPLPDIESMADWLWTVLDKVEKNPVFIVGHSMGALVALEAVARRPERAEKLALLGFGYPMKVSDKLLAASREDPNTAFEMIAQWSHASPVGGGGEDDLLHPGARLQTLRLMQKIAQSGRDAVLSTDLTACNAYRNGEVAACSVACDCLFLLACQDKMTPQKASTHIAGIIRQSKLVSLADCGHQMMADQPQAVCEALWSFAV